MKPCTRCLQSLPFAAFYPNRAKADGLSTWCRACSRQYDQDAKAQPALPEGMPKWLTGVPDAAA